MSMITDATNFSISTIAFVNALENYAVNSTAENLRTLGLASGSLAVAGGTLLDNNPILAKLAGPLGVVSSIANLNDDVAELDNATLSRNVQAQNSALLGVISDASGMAAGTTTIIAGLTAETGAELPLGIAAAALTGVSFAAAAVKLAYDTSNNESGVINYMEQLKDSMGEGYISSLLNWLNGTSQNSALNNALNNFLIGSAQAAELGDSLSFSSNNSTFSALLSGKSGPLFSMTSDETGACSISNNNLSIDFAATYAPEITFDNSGDTGLTFAETNAILKVQSLNAIVDSAFSYNVQGATNVSMNKSGALTASDGTSGSPQLVIQANGTGPQLQTASGVLALPTQSNATSTAISMGANGVNGTVTGSDNSSTKFQASADGSTLSDQKFNANQQIISQSMTYADAGVATTTYSTNVNDTWQSKTQAFDDDGNLVANVVVNKDGTGFE